MNVKGSKFYVCFRRISVIIGSDPAQQGVTVDNEKKLAEKLTGKQKLLEMRRCISLRAFLLLAISANWNFGIIIALALYT